MFIRKKDHIVPEIYENLYLAEQKAFNFRHIKNITHIMLALSAVLWLQHQFFPQSNLVEYAHYYKIVLSLLLFWGVIYLLITKIFNFKKSDSVKKLLFLIYLYILSFLLMSLNYLDLYSGQSMTGYIIALIFLSTMIWFRPREFSFISAFVLFLLILSYLILSSYIVIPLYQVMQGIIFYGLSWALFLSISQLHIENFLNRITVEKQYEMLETESPTDPLTGLYNRRYLKEEIQKELARTKRSGANFCLLIIEIDNFKKIIESYGHRSGDSIFKELSALLRNSVRLSDNVFRYGSGEFVILLPDTLAGAAGVLGLRIREKIENYSFEGVGKKVTISGGIAQTFTDCSMELLIQKAEKQLAQAKDNGRNTIVWPQKE